jgi:nucleoside-diphosphate-sugar epimerase
VRVVVLGGTGFIGGYVVQALVRNGHDVAVFHRGVDEPDLPSSVRHIHGRFDRLADYGSEFRRLRPDVVLDMVPYINKDGHGISHFRAIAERAVVISSGDVYRAFGRLWKSEPGPPDLVPLREDAPLRSLGAPDGLGEDEFDNLEAERAALAEAPLAATILRLPATHGPGDAQHRLARYVRAMEDRRPAMAKITAWRGEVRVVRDERLPVALRDRFDFTQHLVVDTTAIRSELGFREPVGEAEGLRRSIEWERQTLGDVPDLRLEYAAEDEALAARLG